MEKLTPSEIAAVCGFFTQRTDAIVDLIREVVAIESPSGDLQGSQGVVKLLKERARDVTSVSAIEVIHSPGYGEHLLVRAFSNQGANHATTMLLGHTDTVHQRGTVDPASPLRSDGDKLYGPGIFDMKGACVLAIEVLDCLTSLDLGPSRPVTLLLTCDEEAGSTTGRKLVEREAPLAAQVLVLEPPGLGGCVKTSRKGVGQWIVEAHGIASHAGLDPEAGASAILELARQTEKLHSLRNASRGTTFNVGVIRGGTRSNVVAEKARMEVDVRFTTAAEANRVEELMQTLQPFDPRVRLTADGGINRGPLERTESVVKLFRHAQGIAGQLGFNLEERSVGGASDGNFAAALNVPVLDGLGIDGDGAHAAHEHILISDIAQRGALLTALVATL